MDRRELSDLIGDPEAFRRYLQQTPTPDAYDQGHQTAVAGGEWVVPTPTQAPIPRAGAVPVVPAQVPVEVRFEISGKASFEPANFHGKSWEILRDQIRQVVYNPQPEHRWWLPELDSDITRIWVVGDDPAAQEIEPPAPSEETLAQRLVMERLIEQSEARILGHVNTAFRSLAEEIKGIKTSEDTLERLTVLLRGSQGHTEETTPPKRRRSRRKPQSTNGVEEPVEISLVTE